jgi:hypothetical protein
MAAARSRDNGDPRSKMAAMWFGMNFADLWMKLESSK